MAFIMISKIQEHMLNKLIKTKDEESLDKPLQNNHKQYKTGVTFLTCLKGLIIVTNKHKKLYFAKSITDKDGVSRRTIPSSAYELKSLNDETKTVNIEELQFSEAEYPFAIKPKFSFLYSFEEISRQNFRMFFSWW